MLGEQMVENQNCGEKIWEEVSCTILQSSI